MSQRAKPWVIDGDGHVLEPRDLWEKNLPAEYRDVAIKVVTNADTDMEDECVDGLAVVPGWATTNGWARSPLSRRADVSGWRWEELPAAGRDPKARVAELDRDGIDVAVLYPSLGLLLGGIRDPRHAVLACRVYNDWLAEFCSAAPERLIGVAALPLQDPEACPAEARRAVDELGMRGVFVRPANGYGNYLAHHPVFDPLWATVQELGVPVGFHPAGVTDTFGAATVYGQTLWTGHVAAPEPGVMGRETGDEFAFGKTLHFLFDDTMQLTMLIGTGLLDRFPELKVLILECGVGWLPHWIDKLDHWIEVVPWQRPLELKPSEYVQRQVWVSADPDETTLPYVVSATGADHIIWASDYPHMDVLESEPSATAELYENMRGMPESDQAAIAGENARALYGLGG